MKSPPPAPRTLRIVVVNTAPCAGEQAVAAQARRNTALRIGLLESGYDIVASRPISSSPSGSARSSRT
jgi:response regulator NasT